MNKEGPITARPRCGSPAHPTCKATFHVGRWRVDANVRTVTDGAVVRRLSPRANELLAVLVEAEGDVVARSALLDAVWPNVTVGDESLTQAVAELRRAFGDRRGGTTIIETIPKRGYRLSAPVFRDVGSEHAPRETEGDAFDLGAYLLCLEAGQAMARSGKNAMEWSEALRREAIERAPRFALAHAEYAIVLGFAGLYRDRRIESLKQSVEHADKAAELRPDLAIAHAARGFALGAVGRHDAALTAFARSFSIDARDATAHYLCARTLFASGNLPAAVVAGERAADLAPDDPRALFLAGRASPDDPRRTRANMARCRARIADRLAADPTEPRSLNSLGGTLAFMGEPDAARAAIEADKDEGSVLQFYKAVGEAALGEVDRALDALESVVENGFRHGSWLLAEPMIARLHGEPRYRRIERALVTA